jgi:sterol 14-demethylase
VPWVLSPVVLAAVLLGLATSYAYTFVSGEDATKMHQLGGFSIINAWTFFNKRYEFLWSNFNKTGQDLFSFKVLQVSLGLRSC